MVNVLTMTTPAKVMLLHAPSCDLLDFNICLQAYAVQEAPDLILPAALENVPLDAEDGQASGAAERDLSHAAQQAATAASASPEVLLSTSKKAQSFSLSSTLCIPVLVSWSLSITSKVLWCQSGCAWQDDIQSAASMLMLC